MKIQEVEYYGEFIKQAGRSFFGEGNNTVVFSDAMIPVPIYYTMYKDYFCYNNNPDEKYYYIIYYERNAVIFDLTNRFKIYDPPSEWFTFPDKPDSVFNLAYGDKVIKDMYDAGELDDKILENHLLAHFLDRKNKDVEKR